jgi:hypothetical protein
MRCRTAPFAVIALLLSSQARAAPSAWDETQLQLLRQYSTPLRWYNVEGSPYWVAGPSLHHQLSGRPTLVQLEPGQATTLRAAPHTWLRLVGKAKTLYPEDLEASISFDARTFTAAVPLKTADPYSLLIALPQDQPSLVRLTRSGHADSKLEFAAYLSVEQPFKTLAPYRESFRMPGKAARLRRDDEAVSEPAWLIQPKEGIEFSLRGPARLQFVARLPWPSHEPLREQALVLQLRLDGADPLPLLLSPELDARHRTRLNHSLELVSHRMNGFLNVPAGKHSVRMDPTVPFYLSVFLQPQPDFLWPWLNGPTNTARQVLRAALQTGPDESAIAFGPLALPLDAYAFANQEQAAWRLARDNHRLDSAGQATDWLNRISQTREDYPPARETAATLWRQRTFYREVMPTRLPADEPIRQFLFSPARLRGLFEPERPVAVQNPTVEQIRELLAEGHFVPVPDVLSPGLLYQLPRRSFDSKLRIAVLPAQRVPTQLFVQFDQETPVKVLLDAKVILPPEELEPSPAFATLRVLQQEAHLPAPLGFGEPVGEFDLPLPIEDPGVIEVPLPQRVRQVRLYQEPPARPVMASVAYGAAKPFELGESSYRSLLNQTDSEQAWRILASPRDGDPTAPEPLRQLSDHLLPLVLLLRAHYSDFTNSVSLAPVSQETDHPLASETVSKLKQTAESLEREDQRIDALEIWNRIFWEGSARDRLEAALSIMRDLQLLGEDFLAMQFARWALLKAPAGETPSSAVALLEDDARQAEDTEQLEQVRAFLFMHCPCPQHLASLVEGFALNSRDQMVLSAGLLLPREKRPAEPMLGAALRLNWWKTFDRLAEDLPEPAARGFWRAQKDLAFYRFAEAEQDLKQAGEEGSEMLRALQQGIDIRERLTASDLSERLDAVFAWERWQSHQPGPRIWRTAEDVVYACAGTELLFNSERNQFTPFFRAERGKPVRLRFLGPVRLQVEARPLLELPFEKPVDDWLEISEYGITNRVPICQCIPNPGLEMTTTRAALVGLKRTVNLEWGPGLHEVEVGLAGRTGLVRVLLEQPVMPLRILPALNVERLNRILQTERKPLPRQRQNHVRPEREFWWIPPELAAQGARSVAPGTPNATGDAETATPANPDLTKAQSLRLALRSQSQPDHSPDCSSQEFQALPLAEQWLAACRGKRWSDFTNWQGLPEVQQANYLLATHRIRQLLDQQIPRDILPRLVTLLQVSEEFPAWRGEAQCRAELLAAGTNCPPGCTKIMVRLTQNLAWIPLPVSPLAAGIRPLQVPSDLPQDPSVRMRRALLPPAGTNQFTIAARNEFAASMSLQHPAHLQMSAELARAGFSPLAPLAVSFQVDAGDIQHLPLAPLRPVAGTNFTLAEGPHLVRVWIEDPVVNQFVRISFAGESGIFTNTIWSQPVAQAGAENRFFHAATAAQPMRFSWKGPTLLRLDEWREGRFLSQLRFVQGGEQAVEVLPAPGRTESWYRVFVRTTQTNQPDVRSAWAIREPEEVLPPELRLPPSIPPSRAQLVDYYGLGGQEAGTWTASVLAAHRWPFEPGARKNAPVNDFIEANEAYRKLNLSETLWSETEALARVHRSNDLTFALSERLEGHPQEALFDWSWLGRAFVGSVGPQQHDIEGAFYTALEIGQHRHLSRKLDYYPFAALFAHYLTLNATNAAQYKYIDQDLFTGYRSTHRWGGMLANQLEYQPWLDTLLRGYIDMVSNKDFTPDQWGMRFAWNQMLGPLRAEVIYEFRQFLQDADRSSASWIQGIAGGLYAEHWLNGQNRIEFGAQYRHDWPGTGSSYFLVLRWEFSHGRGYKDHSPQEMAFRDLRNRRIPSEFNNLFQTGPPGASLP